VDAERAAAGWHLTAESSAAPTFTRITVLRNEVASSPGLTRQVTMS
jgi:hypothetical protein